MAWFPARSPKLVARAALAVCLASALPAAADDSPFSLTADLVGQNLSAPVAPSSSLGFGGSVFADFRAVHYLSVGIGLDYSHFSGTSSASLTSVDVAGRIFP